MSSKPLKAVNPIRKDSRDDQTITPIQDVDAPTEPATQAEKEKEQKSNQYKLLRKALAEHAEFFLNQDSLPFFSIDLKGYRETYPLDSEEFYRTVTYLDYNLLDAEGVVTTTHQRLLAWADSQAHHGGKVYPIFVRVGEYGGKYYLDCTDERWTAIEISKHGWKQVDTPPVRFVRHENTPIIMPTKGGSFQDLKQFANVSREAMAALAVFLMGSLTLSTAYPILILNGEQRTGKTLLVRYLKRIFDPTVNTESSLPRTEEALFLQAQKIHFITYGNLEESRSDAQILAALARLSTGGAAPPMRGLYTQNKLITLKATKPIILSGIENVLQGNDQFDRALVVELQPLDQSLPDWQLEERFQKYAPSFFGAVLDGLVEALNKVKKTDISKSDFRMQGAMLRAEAVEADFGFNKGEIIRCIDQGKADEQKDILDKSPTTKAILSLLAKNKNQWEGSSTDCLDALKLEVDPEEGRYIPQHPQSLTKWLRRHGPELRTLYGIHCNREHRCKDSNRSRGYEFTRTPEDGKFRSPWDPKPINKPDPTQNGTELTEFSEFFRGSID